MYYCKPHWHFFLIAFFCVFQSFLGTSVVAQTKWDYPNFDYHKTIKNERFDVLNFSSSVKLSPHVSEIKAFLWAEMQSEMDNNSHFELLHQAKSKLGWHYTFGQTIGQTPVLGTFLKLNVAFDGRIISAQKKLYNAQNILLKATQNTEQALEKINQFLAHENLEKEKPIETIWSANDKGELSVQYRIFAKNTENYYEIILDPQAQLQQFNNRSAYCHNEHCQHATPLPAATDSTVKMWVFMPDPLTSAQKNYGAAYIDKNDEDIPELNAQRLETNAKTKFENGLFYLENNFVKITDNLAPSIPPYTSQTPIFNLTRSQTGFEDVNVFFHITAFQNYLQNLGIDLATAVAHADAHSLNFADNSRFVADANGKIYLDFGQGNVDDAEDADVIIHEYTHALSYMANNSNTGMERRAIDEAIGDYFATSWSRSFSDFRWQDMFTWDGHNEFWNGRNMQTNKTYPSDVSGDIYGSSEVFSSALMDIYAAIGKQNTDILVAQLLYFLTPNITMPQAANFLYEIDEILFNEQYKTTICQQLYKRNLTEKLYISAGKDTTICLGERLVLGQGGWENLEGLTFEWTSDNATIKIENAQTPQANCVVSGDAQFFLQTTDTKNNTTYTDTVKVEVENCVDFEGEVALLNELEFTIASAPLLLQFAEEVSAAEVRIFDIQGRQIWQFWQTGNDALILNLDYLPPSMYFIQTKINQKIRTFKVLKAW